MSSRIFQNGAKYKAHPVSKSIVINFTTTMAAREIMRWHGISSGDRCSLARLIIMNTISNKSIWWCHRVSLGAHSVTIAYIVVDFLGKGGGRGEVFLDTPSWFQKM